MYQSGSEVRGSHAWRDKSESRSQLVSRRGSILLRYRWWWRCGHGSFFPGLSLVPLGTNASASSSGSGDILLEPPIEKAELVELILPGRAASGLELLKDICRAGVDDIAILVHRSGEEFDLDDEGGWSTSVDRRRRVARRTRCITRRARIVGVGS